MDKETYDQSRAVILHPVFRLASEFIQKIGEGSSNHYLLCLYGPSGFGRTLFAKNIWHNYRETLPEGFVAIKDYVIDNKLDTTLLLRTIIQDLFEGLPSRFVKVLRDYTEESDKDQLADFIKILVEQIADYGKFTLLVIDDFDYIPYQDIAWFKTMIFKPLVLTKKIVFILTSESKLRFDDENDFILHTSLENIELSNLDAKGILAAFPEYGSLADTIYDVTGGLITLITAFINLLQQNNLEFDTLVAHKEGIIQTFRQSYVEKIIFDRVEHDLHEVILILSMLRRFDIKILPKLLLSINPDKYVDFGTIESLDLIDRLGTRVCWRKQGGYALSNPLRLVLIGYINSERRELIERINRAMINMYRDLILDAYRESYLVEMLYHSLNILPDKEHSKIRDTLGKDLITTLDGDITASFESVDFDSLQNTLKNDPDLKDYISESVISYIKHQTQVLGIEEKLLNEKKDHERINKSSPE